MVREHRCFFAREVRSKTLEKLHAITLRWKLVPPTIDSTGHAKHDDSSDLGEGYPKPSTHSRIQLCRDSHQHQAEGSFMKKHTPVDYVTLGKVGCLGKIASDCGLFSRPRFFFLAPSPLHAERHRPVPTPGCSMLSIEIARSHREPRTAQPAGESRASRIACGTRALLGASVQPMVG